MKKILIPIKNLVFDNEKLYIEKKYTEGFKLKKRGLFFYSFEETSPSNITCEIDLVEKKFCDDVIADWEIVSKKKTRYNNLYKVYYVSKKENARLITNIDTMLAYYKYYQQLFIVLSSCAIAPFLFSFVLMTATIKVPNSILLLTTALLIPFIYFIRNSNVCEKIVCTMSASQGKLTGFEANYILTFKNFTSAKDTNLEMDLADFGLIKKIDNATFRIQSPLKKEELYKEISYMLSIEESSMNIMHIGDLYVIM